MALDFTYQPPPPLQVPGIPSARPAPSAGSSGALTAIMAQRMKQKVAKQQAENVEAAQEQVLKLFKERDAVYEVPMTMAEAAGFASHSRETFEGMLQSEEFGKTAEQAEGEANLAFAPIPIPFFRPGVLAEASRILSNAGMSNDARDDWLKHIADGRHPNMAEGMAWFHEKAMDWKKSLYYGRPTSTTTFNMGVEKAQQSTGDVMGALTGRRFTPEWNPRQDKWAPDMPLKSAWAGGLGRVVPNPSGNRLEVAFDPATSSNQGSMLNAQASINQNARERLEAVGRIIAGNADITDTEAFQYGRQAEIEYQTELASGQPGTWALMLQEISGAPRPTLKPAPSDIPQEPEGTGSNLLEYQKKYGGG